MREQPGPITSVLYISYLGCPRRAWYEYAGRRSPRSPSREMQWSGFFDAARNTVLPRIDDDFRALGLAGRIEKTRELLRPVPPAAAATPGAEEAAVLGSAFLSGPFLAEPDLFLRRAEGGFEITELKTAASLKNSHIVELAWQIEILGRLGIFPRKISLVHINRDFTLHRASGPGGRPSQDYTDLFIARDVTKRVCAAAGEIGEKMEALSEVLEDTAPPPPALACAGPDRCPYGSLCRPEYPKHHVFTLHQGSRTSLALFEQGIIELKDVPEDFRVSRKQRIQIEAARSGTPFIDHSALEIFLGPLEYPLSFLDFETFSTAVPLYEGVSPWEHIPFAFSLHIQNSPLERPIGFFFMADETADPRPPFLAALSRMLPRKGSIIVYNRRFEAEIVRTLGAAYPEWKLWADGTCARMTDLLVPFHDFRYYHPDQLGRVSMKKVLPALTGREYSGLSVENGEEANSLYAELVLASRQGSAPMPDREKVREALEEYCSLDTEGMVLILQELYRAAGKHR